MKVAVIDLDSVAYAMGNPNKVMDSFGMPLKENGRFVYVDKTEEELTKSVDTVFNQILRNCKAEVYVGFIKGNNTTAKRLAVNPEYKAQRSKEEPKWWQTVKDRLMYHWQAQEVDGIEVDDAVNITRLSIPESFIVAVDGDLLGLEGTHFNWRKNEWVTTTADQASFNFWSDMIIGQPIDNVKGLKGCGEAFVRDIKLAEAKIEQRPAMVLHAYMNKCENEHVAMTEFYMNYTCLRIKAVTRADEFFIVPKPIPVPETLKLI